MGTVYFKKHLSSVVSKLGFETPDQLYNSIEPSLSVEERHNQWYLNIKRVIFVQSEDQRPPTLKLNSCGSNANPAASEASGLETH